MKKSYLLPALVMASASAMAQLPAAPKALVSRSNEFFAPKPAQMMQNKAEGDVLYSSDFSNATQWTFVDNSVPTFANAAATLAIGTAAPTGSFSAPMGAIASPTAANGFAKIDSDAAYAAEGAQDVKLVFNTPMDFSSATLGGVTLQFYSYHRKFRDSVYVEFSTDGGATWANQQIELDAELNATDASPNPKFVSINVSQYVLGQANVRMRFRYIGEWDYAWMVDDVKLIESFDNDIAVDQWYMTTLLDDGQGGVDYGQEYYKVPVSQTNFPTVGFGADITNQGTATQETRISATQNGGTAVLGGPVTVASTATDTLELTTGFTLASGANAFAVKTVQTSGADDLDLNSSKTFNVTFGGNEFSRHNGVATKVLNYTAAGEGYRVANDYVVTDPMLLKEVMVRINNGTQNPGNVVGVEIEAFNGTDFDLIATLEADVTSTNNGNFVKVDFSGEGITLAETEATLYRVWAFIGAGNPVRFVVAQNTVDQTSFLRFDNDPESSFFINETPMIHLVEGYAGIEENNAEVAMNVYPNPAKDAAKVSFKLANNANVVVNVLDMSGKVVATETMSANAGANSIELNTSSLVAGIYTVSFEANGAVVTQKLAIK